MFLFTNAKRKNQFCCYSNKRKLNNKVTKFLTLMDTEKQYNIAAL